MLESSKNSFLDTVEASEYIQIEKVYQIYKSLKNSIGKPLKMILLYGKPGTGKSMLLNKLYYDLKDTQSIFLYKTPILDDDEFFRSLALDIFGIKDQDKLNYTQFMKIVETNPIAKTPIVLLDEAQLYSDEQLEKIRLLSDTRKVKFVITLHKTKQEDLIAKEHFQTRIWESIILNNATKQELKIYIQKKLLKANCFDIANMITDKNINLIYKLTSGNYRDTNKLLYTIFEIYIYYVDYEKKRLNETSLSSKIIEMSAIHTGLIDAN